MATGATEFVDSTTANVFIPELWSLESVRARENRLVYAKLVDRKFEKNLSFGDLIHVQSISNLTAQTKAKSDNTANVFETQTETNTDITIATWEYTAMAVEDIVTVQANRDLFASYAGKMGYALDLAVDNVLAGLADNASNTVGTLATDLTYDDLLRARQYLDDADAPQEDRVIVVSPAQEAGMMKLDHFINSDYSQMMGTSKNTSADRGYFGSWLGMPVYKSVNVEGTNAAGHDNCMLQKEAWTLIMQMKPKTESARDIDYFVDKVAMQHLHGSQEMRDDHAVWMQGS
jgi:N4-gp56 family major capsid protein